MLGVNSFLQGLVNFAVPGVGLVNAIPGFLSSPVLGAINNALSPAGPVNYGIPVDDMGTYVGKNTAPDFTGSSLAEQQAMNEALGEAAVGSYGGGSFAEQQAMNEGINAQSMQSMQDAQQADTTAAQGGGGGVSDTNSPGADAASAANAGENAGGEGPSGGESLAKGGFIKKKKNVVAKTKRGLASR
jgi:hypothetical protein